MQRAEAWLDVDESSIASVRPGQSVQLQLNTRNGVNFRGIVTEVLPAFDERTQAFRVKVRALDPPTPAFAGTQLQANIETRTSRKALLIPRRYLTAANQVWIKGSPAPVTPKLGIVGSEWVEILAGIDENAVLELQSRPAR
jgi:multidrug efflux pump subunit AcrA (membrane-fusion protein)